MITEQKLALGTVQFGLPYGVTNKIGITPAHKVADILQFARHSDIDTLDTAVGYGDSESVLGRLGVEDFRVVTKLSGLPQNESRISSWVFDQVRGSIERLGLPVLGGVLLHRPGQLLESYGPQLYSALQALKADGLVKKIGISIYDPSELDQLVPTFKFDLIQAPLSVVDQRLIDSGWARRLNDLGVEIHSRSCFLQGLLLMPAAERPEKFKRFESVWEVWDRWLSETRLSPLEACIRYAISRPEITRVIVGVESVAQLDEIVRSVGDSLIELPAWPISPDPLLINPFNWTSL